MPEAHLQGGRGDGADAQLADQCVCHAGPGLFADGCVDRVRAIEVGPVAAVDRDLVRGAGRVDRAVGGGEVLVEDDRLRAVQRVVGDRRHLVHVLAAGVDDRVIRVELAGDDRVAPVVR